MNYTLFIAKNLLKSKATKNLSLYFFKISTLITAISFIVIIWSIAIIRGFNNSISEKIVSLNSHIIIRKHTFSENYQASPILFDSTLFNKIQKISGVKNIQTVAYKAGLIKKDFTTFGILLKGIDKNFDWKNFEKFIIQGRKIYPGNENNKEIIISKTLADKLNIKLNDYVFVYFFENQMRFRKYQIVGIYHTHLPELDMTFAFTDILDIQRLNNWSSSSAYQISAYEIGIDNLKNLDKIAWEVFSYVQNSQKINAEILKVETIKDIYPQLFDWLSLISFNSIVLLLIMGTIVAVTMTTTLLILILDKVQQIAIFKVIGANNSQIRQFFLAQAFYILAKGLFLGNLIAIITLAIQYFLKPISLNPEIYFIDYVPVMFGLGDFVFVNIFLIIATLLTLLVPSQVISKIQPAKSLKFE